MPKAASPIPPGVASAMRQDAAASPKGKHHLAERLAEAYGVTEAQAAAFLERERKVIDDLRGKVAEGALLLSGHGLSRISEALADDEKMKGTPLRDMAMTVEKLVNTAVTAQEGHRPNVVMNFGDILQRKQRLEKMDAQLKLANRKEMPA